MVAFESLHTLRRRNRGRKGLMALKLDMNKAYDRVEWNFLSAIMLRLGFSVRRVARIMDYLRNTCFSILINGRPSYFFRPSRGLRNIYIYMWNEKPQGLDDLIIYERSLRNATGRIREELILGSTVKC